MSDNNDSFDIERGETNSMDHALFDDDETNWEKGTSSLVVSTNLDALEILKRGDPQATEPERPPIPSDAVEPTGLPDLGGMKRSERTTNSSKGSYNVLSRSNINDEDAHPLPERHRRPDSSSEIEGLHRLRRGLGTPSSPGHNSRLSTPLQHTRRELSKVETSAASTPLAVPPLKPQTVTGGGRHGSDVTESANKGASPDDEPLSHHEHKPTPTTNAPVKEEMRSLNTDTPKSANRIPPRSPSRRAIEARLPAAGGVTANQPQMMSPLQSQASPTTSAHNKPSSITSGGGGVSWTPILNAVGASGALSRDSFAVTATIAQLYNTRNSTRSLLSTGSRSGGGGAGSSASTSASVAGQGAMEESDNVCRPSTASEDLKHLTRINEALRRDVEAARQLVSMELTGRRKIAEEEAMTWQRSFLAPHDRELRYFNHVFLAKQVRREAEEKHTARISGLMRVSKAQQLEEHKKSVELRAKEQQRKATAIREDAIRERDAKAMREEAALEAVAEHTSMLRVGVTAGMRSARINCILKKRGNAAAQKLFLAEESANRVLVRVEEKRRKTKLTAATKALKDAISPSAFLKLPPLERSTIPIIIPAASSSTADARRRRVVDASCEMGGASSVSETSMRVTNSESSHRRRLRSPLPLADHIVQYALVEDAETRAVNAAVARVWGSWKAQQGVPPPVDNPPDNADNLPPIHFVERDPLSKNKQSSVPHYYLSRSAAAAASIVGMSSKSVKVNAGEQTDVVMGTTSHTVIPLTSSPTRKSVNFVAAPTSHAEVPELPEDGYPHPARSSEGVPTDPKWVAEEGAPPLPFHGSPTAATALDSLSAPTSDGTSLLVGKSTIHATPASVE